MKTRIEMLKDIYITVGIKSNPKSSGNFISFYGLPCKPVLIGDILDYVDNYLFKTEVEKGWISTDIQAREKCVIAIYNYWIGNYRNPIEKLDDSAIIFIYNLIIEGKQEFN